MGIRKNIIKYIRYLGLMEMWFILEFSNYKVLFILERFRNWIGFGF